MTMQRVKDILLIVAIITAVVLYYKYDNNLDNENKIRDQFESYQKANYEKNKKWAEHNKILYLEIDSLTSVILVDKAKIDSLKPTYSPINKSNEELQDYFNNNYN